MDAFFASVEQHDHPELRGKAVAVGGRSRRGVVAAASYEARPFGVRSAMPMMEALKRCPALIVVPPRGGRYAEVSARIFDIFRRFSPLVEGLSLDEAFIDVTASRRLFGDPIDIARQIKAQILEETGLTASAGVAPNKFVAKIASDLDKPDGLVTVAPDEVEAMLAPLPIERMWGIGPTAALRLHEAGLNTIGDLATSSVERLVQLLGSWGQDVHRLARGIDDRPVVTEGLAKSVGAEETFEADLRTLAEIESKLLAQSTKVAHRLFRGGLHGRTVVVKLKYADFTLRTRRARLPEPVCDPDSIYRAARSLLPRFPDPRRGVRLTGVAMADLSGGGGQATLFPDESRKRRERLQEAIESLEDRFGSRGVTRAALIACGDKE
jgi:DNA polymerase-4